MNNLKNIALASNSFLFTHNAFAPAKTYHRILDSQTGEAFIGSIYCRILPALDQQLLYNSINFSVPMSDLHDFPPQNTTVARTRISLLRCPTGLTSGYRDVYGPASYRANVGLGELGVSLRYGARIHQTTRESQGAFDEMRFVPAAEFRNGLGMTIAFAEKLVGSGADPFDPIRDWVPAAAPDPYVKADDWVRICANLPQSSAKFGRTESGSCWMLAGPRFTTFQGALPPNSPIPDCGGDVLNGVGAFGARSMHPGGLSVATADCAVRWVSSRIDPKIWLQMVPRSASMIGDGSY